MEKYERIAKLAQQKMAERSWTVTGLAAAWQVSRTHIANVLGGRRGLTPIMALLAEATLGVPAIDWLRMQDEIELLDTQRQSEARLRLAHARETAPR